MRELSVAELVKCDHPNRGDSVKDRIALAIVDTAVARGCGRVCVKPEKMLVDERVALASRGATID